MNIDWFTVNCSFYSNNLVVWYTCYG
jgi:hypothetical protein